MIIFLTIREDDLGCGLGSISGSFLERLPAVAINYFVAIGVINRSIRACSCSLQGRYVH